MEASKLYASRVVRERFGNISHQTLWRWLSAGILPQPQKINGRNYFDAAAIDALLAAKSGGAR